jgi:hypothetical protein
MKTISIGKHSLQRGGGKIGRASYTNCSEAFASYSDEYGYRVAGFDRDGRRWSITIDDRLVADLATLHAKRGTRA